MIYLPDAPDPFPFFFVVATRNRARRRPPFAVAPSRTSTAPLIAF